MDELQLRLLLQVDEEEASESLERLSSLFGISLAEALEEQIQRSRAISSLAELFSGEIRPAFVPPLLKEIQAFTSLTHNIWTRIIGILGEIKETLSGIFQTVLGWMKRWEGIGWATMIRAFGPWGELLFLLKQSGFFSMLQGVGRRIWHALSQWATNILKTVVSKVKEWAGVALPRPIQEGLKTAKKWLFWLGLFILAIIGFALMIWGIWQMITAKDWKKKILGALMALLGLIPTILNPIGRWLLRFAGRWIIRGLWALLRNIIWPAITSIVEGLASALGVGMSAAWAIFVAIIVDLIGVAVAVFSPQKFKDFFAWLFEKIVGFLLSIGEWFANLLEKLPGPFKYIGKFLKAFIDSIRGHLGELSRAFGRMFRGFFLLIQLPISAIMIFIRGIWHFISDLIHGKGVKEAFEHMVQTLRGGIMGIVTDFLGGIKDFFTSILRILFDFAQKTGGMLARPMRRIYQRFRGFFDIILAPVRFLARIFQELMKKIKSFLPWLPLPIGTANRVEVAAQRGGEVRANKLQEEQVKYLAEMTDKLEEVKKHTEKTAESSEKSAKAQERVSKKLLEEPVP